MDIITTQESNRNSYLTFLNTYPSGGKLELPKDYKGTYWRPVDKNSYTSKADIDNYGKVELGFNVCWGEFDSEHGIIPVRISLMLSETKYWLNVSNHVSNPSATTITRGYNYSFEINGVSYSITAPIIEVENNNNNKPDFSVYDEIKKKYTYYTFKAGNASSNRKYISEHSTEIWFKKINVKPVSGKASIEIKVKNLFLHWLDIYNGKRPTIYVGNSSKTFDYSGTIYSNVLELNPNRITFNLQPKSAELVVNTPERNFDIGSSNKAVASINASVTSFKDSVSNHKIELINKKPELLVGATKWTSFNSSLMKVSPTSNSNYTVASYNYTGNSISNEDTTNINLTASDAGSSLNCSVAFNLSTQAIFSSNNTDLATVSSSGIVTAKVANGTYKITTKFSSGLTLNTIFNSHKTPNAVTITDAFVYNDPSNSVISGNNIVVNNEVNKINILANVAPYNNSNTYASVYTGYRGLLFNIDNTNVGSITSVTNDGTVYNATFVPNAFYDGISHTTNIIITSKKDSSVNVIKSIVVNSRTPQNIPNLKLVITSVNPEPVPNGEYAIVTYSVSRTSSSEPDYTKEALSYLKSINVTSYNTSFSNATANVTANVITNPASVGITLTNPKRQAVYQIIGSSTDTNKYQLPWNVKANFVYDKNKFNGESTSNVTLDNNDEFTLNLNSVSLMPPKVLTYINNEFNVELRYARKSDTTDILIDYPNNAIANVISQEITPVSDNISGTGNFTIKSQSVGYTQLSAMSQKEPYKGNCDIYVVDRVIPSIVYPYIFIKQVNGINNYYYSPSYYNNQELVRLVFKLPPSYIMEAIIDIQVEITTTDNNTYTYSLREFPELFSVCYPLSEEDKLLEILKTYEYYYDDQPYCIFQEALALNENNRDFSVILKSIKLKLVFDDYYSQSEGTSSDSLEKITTSDVSVTIFADNEYTAIDDNNLQLKTLQDVKSLDHITIENMKPFVKAYKSMVLGYVKYAPDIINDYGAKICSMDSFGNKGEPITVEPFYKLLLSENYIKFIDKYLMSRYLDIAKKVLGLNELEIELPETFYSNYVRNMLADNLMREKYNIYSTDEDKQLYIENNPTITYIPSQPSFRPYEVMNEYMAADDSVDYFYNKSIENTYKDNINYNNFTISPLREFTKGFNINRLGLTETYTFGEPVAPTDNIDLLPVMTNMIAIYDYNSYHRIEDVWENKMQYTDSDNLNIKFGAFGFSPGFSAPFMCYDSQKIAIKSNYDSLTHRYPAYGEISLSKLNNTSNLTIYIVARVNNRASVSDPCKSITYISNLVVNSSNKTGFALCDWESVVGNQITYNTETAYNYIHISNGNDYRKEYITNHMDTEYRVYTVSIKTNEDQSNTIKLYVNGKFYRSITNTNGIWSSLSGRNSLTLNAIKPATGFITSSASVLYRYLAIANTSQDDATIKANAQYIKQKYITDLNN